jgi:hypothetical protein
MEGPFLNFSKWAIAGLFLSILWSCKPQEKEEVQVTGPEEILAPEEASGSPTADSPPMVFLTGKWHLLAQALTFSPTNLHLPSLQTML